jgi:hypothetical protein
MTEPKQADPLAPLIQVGVKALREGDRAGARSLFQALVRRHPDHVQLLLWLAASVDSPAERRGALERVLALDPANAVARRGLAALDAASAPIEPARPVEAPLTPEGAGRRLRLLQALVLLLLGVLLTMALLLFNWPEAWSRRPQPMPTDSARPSAAILAQATGAALPSTAVPTPATVTGTLPTAQATSVPQLPAPAAPGSFYERDGWRFGVLAGEQSISLGAIGGLTPQGRFVVVRIVVANSGDAPRALDPQTIALVDSQGRVYRPLAEASAIYLEGAGGRGVAADLAFGDAIPNSGGNLSVPLVFDVAADASELLLIVGTGEDQAAWGVAG